jgi:molybdate transport system regulatory protein
MNPAHTQRPESMAENVPTIRMHLWLETREGLFFGMGRAMLLAKIAQHGSIKKAADDLGMSYRAAWGKIKKSEQVLGIKLIAQSGSKREGHTLTESGKMLMEQFLRWFDEVEGEALKKAAVIFPWPLRSYRDGSSE